MKSYIISFHQAVKKSYETLYFTFFDRETRLQIPLRFNHWILQPNLKYFTKKLFPMMPDALVTFLKSMTWTCSWRAYTIKMGLTQKSHRQCINDKLHMLLSTVDMWSEINMGKRNWAIFMGVDFEQGLEGCIGRNELGVVKKWRIPGRGNNMNKEVEWGLRWNIP